MKPTKGLLPLAMVCVTPCCFNHIRDFPSPKHHPGGHRNWDSVETKCRESALPVVRKIRGCLWVHGLFFWSNPKNWAKRKVEQKTTQSNQSWSTHLTKGTTICRFASFMIEIGARCSVFGGYQSALSKEKKKARDAEIDQAPESCEDHTYWWVRNPK